MPQMTILTSTWQRDSRWVLAAQGNKKQGVKENFSGAICRLYRLACPSLEICHLPFPHNTRLLQGRFYNSGNAVDEDRSPGWSSFSWSLTTTHPPVGAIDRCMLSFDNEDIPELYFDGYRSASLLTISSWRPLPQGSKPPSWRDSQGGRLLLIQHNNLLIFRVEVRRQLKVPPR